MENVGLLLDKKVLVARESARLLRDRLEPLVATRPAEIELDLEGVDLISPSFFDELLKSFLSYLVPRSGAPRLALVHSPVDISSFSHIIETYGLKIEFKAPRWTLQRKSPRFLRPKPRVSP